MVALQEVDPSRLSVDGLKVGTNASQEQPGIQLTPTGVIHIDPSTELITFVGGNNLELDSNVLLSRGCRPWRVERVLGAPLRIAEYPGGSFYLYDSGSVTIRLIFEYKLYGRTVIKREGLVLQQINLETESGSGSGNIRQPQD